MLRTDRVGTETQQLDGIGNARFITVDPPLQLDPHLARCRRLRQFGVDSTLEVVGVEQQVPQSIGHTSEEVRLGDLTLSSREQLSES